MMEEVLLPDSDSPESIGVDPLDSILPDSDDTILPDTEDITVKHEKIGASSSSSEPAVTSSAISGSTSSSSSSKETTAPMTAVFTEAASELDIKAEPGLVSIKKENTFEITPLSANQSDLTEKEEPGKENNKPESDQKTEEKATEAEASKEDPGVEDQESRVKSFSEALEDISSSLAPSLAPANKGEKSKTEDSTSVAPSESETPEEADTEQSENHSEVTNGAGEPSVENKPEEEEEENPAGELMEAEAGAEENINGLRTEEEDFGDLFTDYPDMEESWQETEENLDLGPIDIQGNFEDWIGQDECLEDAPGMEVRDLRDKSEDDYSDPLFDTEDGDLGKEDDMGELDPDMDGVVGQEDEADMEAEGEEGPAGLDVSEESGLSEAGEREAGEDDGAGDQDNLNEDCEDQQGGQEEEGSELQGQEAAGDLQTDQSDIQVVTSEESLSLNYNTFSCRETFCYEEVKIFIIVNVTYYYSN